MTVPATRPAFWIRMAVLLAMAGTISSAGHPVSSYAKEKKVESAASGSAVSEAAVSGKDADKPPLGQIKILVPQKNFRPEGPKKAFRVSFDDIDIEKVLNTKTLSLDLPGKMPSWLKKLDGQRIRLRGYMHPTSAFQEEGIKRFILCRDTSACCFGPNPTVYYLVEVTMKSGTSTRYIENKAMDVEGVFRIKPVELEGTDEIEQFYYLDDAQVLAR